MSAQAALKRGDVAGIVLAAGGSSRMGQGRNKLLECFGERPLVAVAVDALLAAGVRPVVVVTGFEAERVRAALAGRACRFVHHAGWAAGMGESIACGMRVLQEEACAPEAVLLSVGDLPGLRADHVEAILASARSAQGEIEPGCIAVPSFAGRRGHPVLFGAAHFAALAGLRGDEGARGVLAANAQAVRRVEASDDAILRDVDTPEELAAAQTRMDARAGTGEGEET